MRPRTMGKIAVAVFCVLCILTALIYASKSIDTTDELYKSIRGVTYAILSLTFATLYRYFED